MSQYVEGTEDLKRMAFEFLVDVKIMPILISEIVRDAGREFLEACRNDPQCYKTMREIAETSYIYEDKLSEKERAEIHKRVLNGLKQLLYSSNIAIFCDRIDAGQLGTFYEKCLVRFYGEEYDLEEVIRDDDSD